MKPPVKHFGPFLLFAWLGEATRQAFRAVFAYRLARVSHSSSISGRFCLSPGSAKPLVKHFGPFLLFVWLGKATRQAFWGVFAVRVARRSHPSSILGRFCCLPGSGNKIRRCGIRKFRGFSLLGCCRSAFLARPATQIGLPERLVLQVSRFLQTCNEKP